MRPCTDLSLNDTRERSRGPSHHRRLCCPAAPAVLRPPPTPSRLDATSRLTVIRTGCSQAASPGAEEGLPSSRHHLPHVPRPLRREVPRRCTPGSSRLPWPSPCYSGLGSSLLPFGLGFRRGRLRLMLRTARLLPPTWLLTLRFDAGRFPPTPPACYRASWQLPGRDLHPLAVTSLRAHSITSRASPPPGRIKRALWARSTRPTRAGSG